MDRVTPEQQQLALDLAYGVWGKRTIEPEQFLRRFGESDGQALARRLVAEAIAAEDGDDLECSLIVVFTFGVTPELLDPLKHLATVEWHGRHEDVVTLLQDLHSPETVEVLSRMTEWAPARVDDFDANVLATKATWALYKTGGPDARKALERVRDSATDDDLRELAAELLQRDQ